MVYSQFNTKYIYTTFVLIAFGVLSSIGVSLFKKEMFVPMLLVMGIFTFFFFAFFLLSLKRITILNDGFETQPKVFCCHLGNDSIALQSSTIQKSLIPVQEKC